MKEEVGLKSCLWSQVLFYWGIGVGEKQTLGRQVSVQAKRKLYLRQRFLKVKEESFDGHINKENSHMLVNFTNI